MFAYSMREKTNAHRQLHDDVPEPTKQRRLAEVIATFNPNPNLNPDLNPDLNPNPNPNLNPNPNPNPNPNRGAAAAARRARRHPCATPG